MATAEHLMVNVLEANPAVGLISLEDCKILLDIAAGDTSQDAKLQMLIDQNSMIIADMANRDTWAKEKVIETWECVPPVCCPDGSARIWLTRAPVKKADIEKVESPAGNVLDPSEYDVEERTGQVKFPNGATGQIIITYTGGFVLPDEAPLPLRSAASYLVLMNRTEAARESTSGAGVRMIAHKESRIMYFSPKDMAGGSTSGSSGGGSPSETFLRNLIGKYTRYWI